MEEFGKSAVELVAGGEAMASCCVELVDLPMKDATRSDADGPRPCIACRLRLGVD